MAKKSQRSKKTSLLLTLSLLFGAAILAVFSVQSPTHYKNHAASTPSVYSGVYTENGENDFSRITSFEAQAGKPVSLIMFFHYWNAGNFPYDLMNRIRNHGSIPVVSWESYDGSGTSDSSWGGIAKGVKDDYIRQWARDSKNWGAPYFLRFDWEMNGYWEPYANQYEQYVPMWKHVHDIFREEGATNVTWVWCPNVEGYATRTIDQFFPGNDYVDWVCMDGYNFGTTQQGSTWQSFYDLFATTYTKLGRIAPGKPIMLGEFASTEVGGDKAHWIIDGLQDNLPTTYPNIKAIVWFDINKETDWRISSSENARAAYAKAIGSAYYAANDFGGISTSPILPLSAVGAAKVVRSNPTTIPVTNTPTLIPSATPTMTIKPTIKPTATLKNSCDESCEDTLDKNKLTAIIAITVMISAIGAIALALTFIIKSRALRRK